MRLSRLKGVTALSALALLVLLASRVPVATAAPSLTCTGSTPGANGVLDVAVTSAGATDSLTVAESSGNYSLSVTSGGTTSAVCTGTTYPDSGNNGFPTVEVTGSALLATDFQASSTDAGLTFEGQAGAANTLDLGSLPGTGVAVSAFAGKVTWSAGNDLFSGISSFVGSSSGSTTVVADSGDGLNFIGQGTGNALDLSHVPASQPTPLQVNVSGGPANTLADNTAAVGSTVFSFQDVTTFAGSSNGWTTFFAGPTGGFMFDGGGTAGNVLDLGAANSGLNVQVPDGTVSQLTTGTDNFSGIQTFNGPGGGASIFAAGSPDNETFNVPGNGNWLYGGSGTASFNASGNNNDFVAGTADQTFSDSGTGNTLDFYEAAASQLSPLIVNLSGSTVNGVANSTASAGLATYSFGGIQKFAGSSNGSTRFIASGTTGGYTFESNGGNDTLDLSSWPAWASGTDVRLPDGVALETGGGLTDFFVGITNFDGPASGNTNFTADGNSGYTFNGNGFQNVLDLTDAGAGAKVSVAGGTATLASGIDKFSGISWFVGSSAGDTSLDFSDVAASAGTPLKINVSGGTAGGIPDESAAVGSATFLFENIAAFTGSSSGNTTFYAGSTGGFTFDGGGSSGDTLDLSSANSGLFVRVPFNQVAGLTTGTDSFHGIQTFVGPAAGHALFLGGDTSGMTFQALGNDNLFGPGGGSATFDGGSGSGNDLDFTSVSTSTQAKLAVNLSGSTVGSTVNDTATVGASTYAFSGNIAEFEGASSGNTTFIPSASTGGLTFEFAGSGNTLDASAFPGSGTTVSALHETLSAGNVEDTVLRDMNSFVTFDGSSAGNTDFVSDATGGYGFVGSGSGNVLDLTSAGSNVNASVPAGTVSLGPGGTESFSGISSFVGSSSGGTTVVAGSSGGLSFTGAGSGNTLDFGAAGPGLSVSVADGTAFLASGSDTFSGITIFDGAAAGGTTFKADATGGYRFNGAGPTNTLDLRSLVSSGTTVSLPGGTVTWNGGQDSFSGITTFDGSSAGGNTFVSDGSGGHAFVGGGANNVLDLHAAPSSAKVIVNGTMPADSGTVTGLTGGGIDTFSNIQSFTGPATVYFGLTVAKSGNGAGTVTSSPAGITCGSTCAQNVASGTSVTLTAAAAAGSQFDGWSGACTGTGNCSVAMSATRSVTATFTTLGSYALSVTKTGNGAGTVTSSPAGIDCGSTCAHSFTMGTSVTLTPHAVGGSTFEGWTGACTGKAACNVAVTAARSVTAFFATDCVVPRVKGKSLSAAKRAIGIHACTVGKVSRAYSKTKRGEVISQKPKPGRTLAPGAKVVVVVSKGRRPRQ